jgi:hypothetical protein
MKKNPMTIRISNGTARTSPTKAKELIIPTVPPIPNIMLKNITQKLVPLFLAHTMFSPDLSPSLGGLNIIVIT